MNITDMYNQLVNNYGRIFNIKLSELEGRVILTTFPVRGLKYKHISKTKQWAGRGSSKTEFDAYVKNFLNTSMKISGNNVEVRFYTNQFYTNLSSIGKEFEKALERDGITSKTFEIINENELNVYTDDYLIWVRVLDENGNIVRHTGNKIKPNWSLDYMVCNLKDNNMLSKRYELNIKNSDTKKVCELCGEVKNYANQSFYYKLMRNDKEENTCGCCNKYNDRYTCIEENSSENMFRRALVSKGYLANTLDISCDFKVSDNKQRNKGKGYINIKIERQDSKLDSIFYHIGFLVDRENSEYCLCMKYDNFENFIKSLYTIYNNITKLPMNTVFLFKGYKKERL